MTKKISALTAASAAAGANELEINEAGTSKKLTITQIGTFMGTLFAAIGTTISAAGLATGGGSLAANRTITVTAATTAQAQAMASAAVAVTPANLAAVGIFTGLLNGLTLANNAGDATNDIDFTAGQATDSTGAAIITCAALTKQTDVAWAAGTGAGGLDTGAVGNNTYHCFAIKKDSDGSGDFLYSLSATAPTMPSGYTYFRRIGSILRVGGAIVLFIQYGDTFWRSVPVASFSTNNPGTSAVTGVSNAPAGVAVDAILDFTIKDDTPATITWVLITALTQADTAASSSVFTFAIPAATAVIPARAGGRVVVPVDTSRSFRYRMDVSDTDHTIICMTAGWVDRRGRY
jgi:hypothetical protein